MSKKASEVTGAHWIGSSQIFTKIHFSKWGVTAAQEEQESMKEE